MTVSQPPRSPSGDALQPSTPAATPDAATLVRLAEGYLDSGDPLQALALLQPVHEQLAGVASGQSLLGRVYYHSAQLERAQHAFENVLLLDPTDSYARFLLGRTLERRSRPDQALVHYRLAVAMSPNPEYQQRLEQLERGEAAPGPPASTTSHSPRSP